MLSITTLTPILLLALPVLSTPEPDLTLHALAARHLATRQTSGSSSCISSIQSTCLRGDPSASNYVSNCVNAVCGTTCLNAYASSGLNSCCSQYRNDIGALSDCFETAAYGDIGDSTSSFLATSSSSSSSSRTSTTLVTTTTAATSTAAGAATGTSQTTAMTTDGGSGATPATVTVMATTTHTGAANAVVVSGDMGLVGAMAGWMLGLLVL